MSDREGWKFSEGNHIVVCTKLCHPADGDTVVAVSSEHEMRSSLLQAKAAPDGLRYYGLSEGGYLFDRESIAIVGYVTELRMMRRG